MRLLAMLVAATLGAAPLAAQQTGVSTGGPFDWSGSLPAGATLRIFTVHGDVRVAAATGDRASVHADVRPGDRHAGQITFDVIPSGNGVTICARWVTGRPCTERGQHDIDEDSDEGGESAEATFTVQLPQSGRLDAGTGNGAVDVAGTGTDVVAASGNGAVRIVGASGRVNASSGNGDVTVEGAGGPVTANTGNGAVRAYTNTGPVNASSGNGNIDVRMKSVGARSDMMFSTGNGRVSVSVPPGFGAELDADTGHGSVQTDMELHVNGRIESGHLHGILGAGGPRLHLSSGNGDLVIQRLQPS